MAFKLLSATYDCATDLIHIKFTGKNDALLLELVGQIDFNGFLYGADQVTLTTYKPYFPLPDGLYMLKTPNYSTRCLLIKSCKCPKINSIPLGRDSKKYVFSISNLNFELSKTYYYKVYNIYDCEVPNYNIVWSSYIKLDVNKDAIIFEQIDSDFCATCSYIQVYIFDKSGCIIAISNRLIKTTLLKLDVSYSKEKGLQLSYFTSTINVPIFEYYFNGSFVDNKFPKIGTKLIPGRYCFKIIGPKSADDNVCIVKCITVPEDPDIFIPPKEDGGCHLKFDKDILTIVRGIDCSVEVKNKSKITINVDIQVSSTFTDACEDPKNTWLSKQKFELKPGESKRVSMTPKILSKCVVKYYTEGGAICILEKCLGFC